MSSLLLFLKMANWFVMCEFGQQTDKQQQRFCQISHNMMKIRLLLDSLSHRAAVRHNVCPHKNIRPNCLALQRSSYSSDSLCDPWQCWHCPSSSFRKIFPLYVFMTEGIIAINLPHSTDFRVWVDTTRHYYPAYFCLLLSLLLYLLYSPTLAAGLFL